MADLKLDNEFGSQLAGAGSRPAFSHLVRFRPKDVTQKEFPTTLTLTSVVIRWEEGCRLNFDLSGKEGAAVTQDTALKCVFRIANESFATDRFVPSNGSWQGCGSIRFMLASNIIMLVRVGFADSPGRTFGYARLGLGRVGEGEFEVAGEVKESEHATFQDELVGYVTAKFKVTPNFSLNLSKLDSQYDTKNIPSLINVVSADSKTLGHRMGAFKGALQILQSIVIEMQGQGKIGSIAGKQLGVILNQASSAQGIELFEDLLWDLASLSFATHVFEPSLTFFPGNSVGGDRESQRDTKGWGAGGDGTSEATICAELARYPGSFALVSDGAEPVILVAETDTDFHRWTAVLQVACKANSEFDEEKAKKLVIPDYCKDPFHPDHPTAGWLRRKKHDKKALTGAFVNRFFRLECDESIMRYTLCYGKEMSDEPSAMTKINITDGTKILLAHSPPVPTPFALQITVQNVSDFSFSGSDALRVVAQLGSSRQCSRVFCPKKSTAIGSTLLLPVEKTSLPYVNASVATGNIGWFGEEVRLPERNPGGDEEAETLRFFISEGEGINTTTAIASCSVPFSDLPFGRQQDMSLTLEGPDLRDDTELTVSVTMRRLGQYKTAWPAVKKTLLQAKSAGSKEPAAQDLWEGPCMVRTAPQGLEVFSPTIRPDEPNTPVATIDYYSVEAITDVNPSTLDIAVIMEYDSVKSGKTPISSPKTPHGAPISPGTPHTVSSPISAVGTSPRGTPVSPGALSTATSFGTLHESPLPARPSMQRRGSFGVVTRKGKSVTPTLSPRKGSRSTSAKMGPSFSFPKKMPTPDDYTILRISPCPAETLKDLIGERRWMFKCRSMLLYITRRLRDLEEGDQDGEGPLAQNPAVREKLAIASAETYRTLRNDMSEIIKTSDWRHARGVGFTEKQIRMFFRLQRMSVYFAKLLESKAYPLWGFGDPIDPRAFAREDLDQVFESQYVQSGAFGAEAQGIENSVKGVGWALKILNRRLDETKLFYHNSPEDIANTSRIFFQEYFLRCTGELGAHVMSDEVLREVPIEVVVAFVCFLVKRDNAFHDLLVSNSLEPDANVFLTSILSIDSMIRRLTKRTELEIVAQWPNEGDIADDAATAYLTSLLEDCSPDANSGGKLSTRAPEQLMCLLEKYVQLIASQCRARGNLGAKIFEGMFAAMPSYASNATAAVFALNHSACKDVAARYLVAILNDMARSSGFVQELIDGNEEHLEGIPIDVPTVQGGVFSAGVEVACLLADVAMRPMDDVCAEFFQADWYSDDENAVMRKACKLMVMGIDQLDREAVKEPFFEHVVGAAVEKMSFRYLVGLMRRCTGQSGTKPVTQEELERMQADVNMMEKFVSNYGKSVMTSVLHLKEALVLLAERPEILQQAVFVDILRRHKGKEEHVMRMLKILTAVRDDLRNFYVPAWLNKLAQKQTAVAQERRMLEMEGDGRSPRVTFDVFEWVFQADITEPKDAYIYTYLMQCLRNSRRG